MSERFNAIQWQHDHLRLLDQRALPFTQTYIECWDSAAVATAITEMVVRGAPAIGISAAYGVVLSAIRRSREAVGDRRQAMLADIEQLRLARPTAVNLAWALTRMTACLQGLGQNPEVELLALAKRIHQEDIQANRRMGEWGAALLADGKHRVITHCNAGALATGGFGTALGVIRAAYAQGLIEHVYADETRPWLQGSRLTAWELQQDGIPVSVIVDSAAAQVMRLCNVSWVIVGSDRITANGDVVNKIGTYPLAVCARYHGVKFMVAAPTSTVDLALPSGDVVEIENRPRREVTHIGEREIATPGVAVLNPAFDVTPAALVDAIVTERGVVLNPDQKKLAAMMKNAV